MHWTLGRWPCLSLAHCSSVQQKVLCDCCHLGVWPCTASVQPLHVCGALLVKQNTHPAFPSSFLWVIYRICQLQQNSMSSAAYARFLELRLVWAFTLLQAVCIDQIKPTTHWPCPTANISVTQLKVFAYLKKALPPPSQKMHTNLCQCVTLLDYNIL